MAKPHDNYVTDIEQIKENSGFDYINPKLELYLHDTSYRYNVDLKDVNGFPPNFNLVFADNGCSTYINIFAPCIFVDPYLGPNRYKKDITKEPEIIYVNALAEEFVNHIDTLAVPPKFKTIFVDWGHGGLSVLGAPSLVKLKKFINQDSHIIINYHILYIILLTDMTQMSMLDDAYEIHVPMQTNEDGYSNYKWAVTAPEETPIRDNLWLMIPEYISWKVKNGFTTEKEKIDFLRYWDISDTIYRQILTSSELDVINYLYTNPLILYELITPHIKYILERFNPVIKEDIDFIMQTTFGERISHDENGRYIIAGGVSYSEFETLFNSSPSQRFNESHPYPKFTRNEISEAEELTEEMMESKSLYDKYDALAQKEMKTESDTNFIKTFDLQITGLLNITYKLTFIDMLSSYYCNIEEYKRKTLDLIYYKIINGIGLPQKVYDNINVYNIIKIIRHYPFDIIQQGIHNHDSIIWIIADRSSKATEEERFIEGVDYYLNYLDKFDHLAHLLSYWQARYQIPKHNILRALREMYTDIEKTDGKPSHHFTKDDNITRVLEEIHFSGLFELVPKHRS